MLVISGGGGGCFFSVFLSPETTARPLFMILSYISCAAWSSGILAALLPILTSSA